MNKVHQFTLAIRHVVLHAGICFVLAMALSWLEILARIAAAGPNAANEFIGMYFVVWLYVLGPASCLLAAPAHALAFFRAKKRPHLYSVSISLFTCTCVWAFMFFFTSPSGPASPAP
jgi:glucan phosphoethanolaminetransferase (alkaline phosphatase superfamily)